MSQFASRFGASSSSSSTSLSTAASSAPGNALITGLACLGRPRQGAKKIFFDCSFNVGKHGSSQAPTATWGVLSYYNGTKANRVTIDEAPFLYAIVGSIVRMPNQTFLEEEAAIDRKDYEFIIEAERLIPVSPLNDNNPRFTFEPNQAPFISISGVAANCQRVAPFQFHLDVEVFSSLYKRSRLSSALLPVRCIYSSEGRYKDSSSPPMPYDRRHVTVIGVFAGVDLESDRSKIEANGTNIARFVIDVIQISFGGASKLEGGAQVVNALDASSSTPPSQQQSRGFTGFGSPSVTPSPSSSHSENSTPQTPSPMPPASTPLTSPSSESGVSESSATDPDPESEELNGDAGKRPDRPSKRSAPEPDFPPPAKKAKSTNSRR